MKKNDKLLSEFFDPGNKIEIEKPKLWHKVITIAVLTVFAVGLSYFAYQLVLSSKNKKVADSGSKIISAPKEGEGTEQQNDTTPWTIGQGLNLPNTSGDTSTYVTPTITLPTSSYISSPESVINSAPKTNTTPSDNTDYGSTAKACLDMFNARTTALAPYKQKLYDLQNQINNVEATVRGRYAGYLMTEAQLQNAIANERQKLVNQYNEAVKEYNSVASQYPVC